MRLFISGMFLIIWLIATVVLAVLSVVSLIGLLVLIMCPELIVLWMIPAGIMLCAGGWITEEQLDRWITSPNEAQDEQL